MATQAQILRMPNPSLGPNSISEVHHSGVISIVGANGSGKSRLGTWLENPQSLIGQGMAQTGRNIRESYRIGAQRSLSLPEQAQRLDLKRANVILHDGTEHAPGPSRVQGDPVVGQTNDFTALVNALFAERDKQASDYYALGKSSGGTQGVPNADVLDHLQQLWERIFPERKLVIGDHSVAACPRNGTSSYLASRLSDGERVGFYLIGHTLMAPENARVVIDEPELHLHPSIQSNLWNALEAARSDCSFVYITHDLAFAASRIGAPIIVLFDYIAPTPEQLQRHQLAPETEPPAYGFWKWECAPRSDLIPADVVIRILGARRPTLFVEGSGVSLDVAIYEALLPDRHVVPVGNCAHVEKITRAFRIVKSLHHAEAVGVIDRDDRSEAQIARLQRHNVFSLPVAGIENLLALPESVRAYMDETGVPIKDQEERLLSAQRRAKAAMAAVRNKVVAERAQYAIRQRFQSVRRNGDSLDGLRQAFQRALAEACPEIIYAEAQATIDHALLPSTNFVDFLAIFRNKAILTSISEEFRICRDTYMETMVNLIRLKASLRELLRSRLSIP